MTVLYGLLVILITMLVATITTLYDLTIYLFTSYNVLLVCGFSVLSPCPLAVVFYVIYQTQLPEHVHCVAISMMYMKPELEVPKNTE